MNAKILAVVRRYGLTAKQLEAALAMQRAILDASIDRIEALALKLLVMPDEVLRRALALGLEQLERETKGTEHHG